MLDRDIEVHHELEVAAGELQLWSTMDVGTEGANDDDGIVISATETELCVPTSEDSDEVIDSADEAGTFGAGGIWLR